MLNLIYYDLKATLKKLWVYIILSVLFAVVVRLIWDGVFGDTYANDNNLFYISGIVKAVALGMLGVLGFLVSMVIIVTQTKWFDENVLSPQGQLTNMLPVAGSQIMLSKILTALFWSIILVLITIGVTSIFLFNTDMYDSVISTFADFSKSNNINISFVQIVFSGALYVITLATALITVCFLCQLIGQMFNSFRNIIILISFLAIIALSYFVITAFSAVFGITIAKLSTNIEGLIGFATSAAAKLSLVNILLIAVYWLLSSYILNKHLNLL